MSGESFGAIKNKSSVRLIKELFLKPPVCTGWSAVMSIYNANNKGLFVYLY